MNEQEPIDQEVGFTNQYADLESNSTGIEAYPPRAETVQFAGEIETAEQIEVHGINFAVFRLNRDLEEKGLRPVVVNLGHGAGAGYGSGRASLNAFAQSISRPIIVVDMPGMGASEAPAHKLATLTFEELAQDNLLVINSMGIYDFDLVGTSMGAIMGAKISELAGERVKHLVTFSAPSFDERGVWEIMHSNRGKNAADFKSSRESADPAKRAEIEQARQGQREGIAEMPRLGQAKTVLALARYGALLRHEHMTEVASKLAPETRWADITGSSDAFSDSADHLDEVRQRNAKYPHSSSVRIIAGATHAWQNHSRWEVAAIAAAEIES